MLASYLSVKKVLRFNIFPKKFASYFAPEENVLSNNIIVKGVLIQKYVQSDKHLISQKTSQDQSD